MLKCNEKLQKLFLEVYIATRKKCEVSLELQLISNKNMGIEAYEADLPGFLVPIQSRVFSPIC